MIVGRDGSCEATGGFEGRIDDLAVFDGRLSAEQVQDVMNGDFSEFEFAVFTDGFESGDTLRWSATSR